MRLSSAMPVASAATEEDVAGSLTVTATTTPEGRVIGESYRFGDLSTQPGTAPTLSTWLMTWDAYEAWSDGEDVVTTSTLDPEEGGVLVLSNPATLGTAAIGELTVETGGDGVTASTYTRPYALLAGEWIAIGIDAE